MLYYNDFTQYILARHQRIQHCSAMDIGGMYKGRMLQAIYRLAPGQTNMRVYMRARTHALLYTKSKLTALALFLCRTLLINACAVLNFKL